MLVLLIFTTFFTIFIIDCSDCSQLTTWNGRPFQLRPLIYPLPCELSQLATFFSLVHPGRFFCCNDESNSQVIANEDGTLTNFWIGRLGGFWQWIYSNNGFQLEYQFFSFLQECEVYVVFYLLSYTYVYHQPSVNFLKIPNQKIWPTTILFLTAIQLLQ